MIKNKTCSLSVSSLLVRTARQTINLVPSCHHCLSFFMSFRTFLSHFLIFFSIQTLNDHAIMYLQTKYLIQHIWCKCLAAFLTFPIPPTSPFSFYQGGAQEDLMNVAISERPNPWSRGILERAGRGVQPWPLRRTAWALSKELLLFSSAQQTFGHCKCWGAFFLWSSLALYQQARVS